MKKKIIILIGIMTFIFAFAGCNSNSKPFEDLNHDDIVSISYVDTYDTSYVSYDVDVINDFTESARQIKIGKEDKEQYVGGGNRLSIEMTDGTVRELFISNHVIEIDGTQYHWNNKDIKFDIVQKIIDAYKPSPYTDDTLSNDTVKLSVKENDITTDTEAITLVFENLTDEEYIFGEQPLLEVFYNDEWVVVPYKTGIGWNDIAHVIRPNDTREYTFVFSHSYGELTEGNYRIIKDIYNDGSKSHVVAEFEIAD